MGGCSFGKILPINATKCHEEKIYVLLASNFQTCQNYINWNLVSTLPLRILSKPWTLSFKIDTITTKIDSQLKCLGERKKLRFTLQRKGLVLPSLVQIWNTFSEVRLALNLERRWEKTELTNQNLFTTLSVLSHDIHRPGWVPKCWRQKSPNAAFLSFYFKAQNLRRYNYWTVHELSDFQYPRTQTTAKKFFSYFSNWLQRHELWKNTLCTCRYRSSCFDVQKSLQHSFLN